MFAKSEIIICVLVICYCRRSIQSAAEANVKPVGAASNTFTNSASFGYEVLISKMDYLEYKFLELEFEIKEQNEKIMRNQARLEKTHEGMSWMMARMEQAVGRNFTTIMDQSWEILQQQKSCSNHDSLREAIFDLKPIKAPSDNNDLSKLLEQIKPVKGPFRSCKEASKIASGKCMLQPFPSDDPFEGYCEQTKFGGGWLVIQRRYDGSVEFYRNWTEYKNGFGDADKEFWIGLELLHHLTKNGKYQLVVELEDYAGEYRYAMYDGFEIGSEAEKYPLKELGDFNGTAGDALGALKGNKFTTLDSDNDDSSYNCADFKKGAWWYSQCSLSNLNGPFKKEIGDHSIHWHAFKNYEGLKYSRMMIREV